MVTDSFTDRMGKVVMIFGMIWNISGAYVVNLMAVSMTTGNKKLARLLYPMFIDEHSMDLKTKMKINSFIARLNTEFIGFRCFNLFKMTKLAFYEYWLSLTSSYIMFTNILNKIT